jgi:hypothetical protein
MNTTRFPSWLRTTLRACLVIVLSLAMLPAVPLRWMPVVQAAGPPTVNGLFYGDDDYKIYTLYNTSEHGSKLYTYLDNTAGQDSILYVALVVDRSVNDNVFQKDLKNYLKSADWTVDHDANKLIGSDMASFILKCGANTYTWEQDTAALVGGQYVSLPQDGTWPVGMTLATSFTWNVNNYRTKYGTTKPPSNNPPWNMYVDGANADQWHSPFATPPGKDAAFVPFEGYPAGTAPITWSLTYEWEWPLVYEFSINLCGSCGGNAVEVLAGASHNSPSKNEDRSDDFPPDGGNLKDLGDLPATYGTLIADNGPRHEIVCCNKGLFLGTTIDAELNGQPGDTTLGDDSLATDDEDGVTLVNPEWWFEGGTVTGGTIAVTFTAGSTAGTTAWLAVWFDWNYSGSFDAGEAVVYQQVTILPGGTRTESFTFAIPEGGLIGPVLYYRARLFTSAPGGTSPWLGLATNGEVEDYRYEFGPTVVDLLPFKAMGADESVLLSWETTSEIDNLGFNLYRATSVNGARIKLNAQLIPTLVAPGSPFGAVYEYTDTAVNNGKTYYYWLEALDIYGDTQLQGPVEITLRGPRPGKTVLPPMNRQ